MLTKQHKIKQLSQEQITFWRILFNEVSLLKNYHTNLTELQLFKCSINQFINTKYMATEQVVAPT